MKWSESAWNKTSDIYKSILELPFLKELADGSLNPLCFRRYLEQDEIYLGHYARHMEKLSSLFPPGNAADAFMHFAKGSMEAEKQMHQLLISRFGLDSMVTASVVTKCYTDIEDRAISTGNVAIVLAALLPCTWVYNETARHILSSARLEGNPYREWLLTYDDPEFTRGTQLMIELADEYAEEGLREQMSRYFVASSMLEYAFWDYGYRGDNGNYEYLKKIEI